MLCIDLHSLPLFTLLSLHWLLNHTRSLKECVTKAAMEASLRRAVHPQQVRGEAQGGRQDLL